MNDGNLGESEPLWNEVGAARNGRRGRKKGERKKWKMGKGPSHTRTHPHNMVLRLAKNPMDRFQTLPYLVLGPYECEWVSGSNGIW